MSSAGSENSEAIRRVLSQGPVDLERYVGGGGLPNPDNNQGAGGGIASSPEIGSAVSAQENFGTMASSSSSVNGRHH